MFDIPTLTHKKANQAIAWAVVLSLGIVIGTAIIGRAAGNLIAAVQSKPDIAIYLLLDGEDITETSVLRETATERVYFAESKDGPLLVRMRKNEEGWYIHEKEVLRQ